MIHTFLTVSRMHHRSIENSLRGMKIHHSQHRLLVHLSHLDRPPTQKEIAERFHISPAAVATLLKKMEAEGYIEKTVDGADTRSNRIAVTPAGRAILDDTRTRFDAVDAKMMEGLSEEELVTLQAMLDRIKHNLESLCDTGEDTTKEDFS